MNIGQYADAVIRLGRQRGLSITQVDAESSLPQALDALAADVFNSDRASLLQRRFRVTYTGLTGDGLFSTIKTDTGATLASVFIDHIRTESIEVVKYDDGAGNVTTFHRIPGDSEIAYERSCEFFFYDPYIILDAKIRARIATDPPDAGSLANGFLSFQANYTPELAGLPASGELDADLIIWGVNQSQSAPMGEAA